MKLYLDCSSLTNEHISGIGVYNKNLFLELAANQWSANLVVPVLKPSRYLKKAIVEKNIGKKIQLLPPFIFDKKVLYHGPDYKLNTISRGPKVVTIHDMQPFLNKWLDPKFAHQKKAIIEKTFTHAVDRIIAVSHFTKNEILKLYPNLESKIDVVYHGCDFKLDDQSEINNGTNNRVQKLTGGKPYLLFIGNIEERKNLINQIKAFEILKQKNPDLLFVIAGNPGFNSESIFEAIGSSREKESIVLLNYLNESEKKYALTHAVCLMFASWYEGFGIPVIEALATNTPVLISKIGALVEIGGEYCHCADPQDVEDIAYQTALIIKNGNKKLVDENAWKEKWSWEKTAEKTIMVYQKMGL